MVSVIKLILPQRHWQDRKKYPNLLIIQNQINGCVFLLRWLLHKTTWLRLNSSLIHRNLISRQCVWRPLGVARRHTLTVSVISVLCQVSIITLEVAEAHQFGVDFIFVFWISFLYKSSWRCSTVRVGHFSILKNIITTEGETEGQRNSTSFRLNSLLLCKFLTVVMVTTPLRLFLLSRTSYFFCRT